MTSVLPVALSVRSLMNRKADSLEAPQACGSGVPGGVIAGQI
jgi:hypothetical protein